MADAVGIELYVTPGGNDATASGCCESVLASGTAAVTDGSVTVDVSADSPDLSEVAARLAGGETVTIRIDGETGGFSGDAGARRDVYVITAVDDAAGTVTIDGNHLLSSGSGKAWTIGGGFGSLDRALRLVEKSESFDVWAIHVKAGTYTAANANGAHASVRVPGTAISPVVVAGYETTPGDADGRWHDDACRAVIDGQPNGLSVGIGIDASISSSASLYYIFRHLHVTRCASGISTGSSRRYGKLVNCRASQCSYAGLYLGRNFAVIGGEADHNTGPWGLRVVYGSLVYACRLHDNAQTQIEGRGAVVLFTTVWGIAAGEIGIALDTDDYGVNAAVHCTVDGGGTGGTGIRLADTGSALVNCIVTGCAVGVAGPHGGELPVSRSNLYHANTTDRTDWPAGYGDLAADPRFTDGDGGDYTLEPGSPAFGAGCPAGADLGAWPRAGGAVFVGSPVNLGMQI